MQFTKLWWSILGTVLFGLQAGLTDNSVSTEEYVVLGAAVLNNVGTWLIPNTPILNTAKTWVNALVLGSGVLVPLLPNGVTPQEWLTFGIAVGTGAGVFLFENKRVLTPAGS